MRGEVAVASQPRRRAWLEREREENVRVLEHVVIEEVAAPVRKLAASKVHPATGMVIPNSCCSSRSPWRGMKHWSVLEFVHWLQ